MHMIVEFVAHIFGQLLVHKAAQNTRTIPLPVVFSVIVGMVIFFVWLIYFLTH